MQCKMVSDAMRRDRFLTIWKFLKGKLIRFGYKVWCLNTKSGYLINFNIVTNGKSINSKDGLINLKVAMGSGTRKRE